MYEGPQDLFKLSTQTIILIIIPPANTKSSIICSPHWDSAVSLVIHKLKNQLFKLKQTRTSYCDDKISESLQYLNQDHVW